MVPAGWWNDSPLQKETFQKLFPNSCNLFMLIYETPPNALLNHDGGWGNEIIHSPKLAQTFKEESPKIAPEKKNDENWGFPRRSYQDYQGFKIKGPWRSSPNLPLQSLLVQFCCENAGPQKINMESPILTLLSPNPIEIFHRESAPSILGTSLLKPKPHHFVSWKAHEKKTRKPKFCGYRFCEDRKSPY